ncbi:prohibitin family protein [Gemmiger formicilis]|jgi:regulator of protease activity HflC (stomatin/prohibitin superfamily)|uniref:prohibitin family protein n=1 Tax=Gemmiger formicilis TaxID=745368 RepID=UPI003522702F
MRKSLGGIATAVIIALVVIVLFVCTVRIPAGYVGVVYNMNGGISDRTLTQGFHVISPTQNVTTYSIGIEQSYLTASKDGDSSDDESFEVPSNDGKGLTVDMTFTYRYDADRVADTFTRFKGQSGKDVKNSFIKPNIMSWTKEVTAKYSVIDLLGDKRATLNSELTDYLKQKFEPYGIVIESVSLINIDPDEETRSAVQKKVNAQQDLELAKIEQQTANVNAEKEKEVAITKANQEKETAQINAEAKLIEAQAQADANRLISQSLTPELIRQQMYDKWDGKLPTVQAGNDSSVIVDTSDILQQGD